MRPQVGEERWGIRFEYANWVIGTLISQYISFLFFLQEY